MTEFNTYKEVELELKRREEEDPLGLVYKPHEFQIEAHSKEVSLLLVLGGNRTGKSWFAIADCLMRATGKSKFRRMREPPVTIWYVMPSLTMYRRTVLPILRKLAPRKDIVITTTGDVVTKKDNIVKFKNGSTIHFLSADMRQRRLQGADVDYVYMDETPDEVVFEELQARVLNKKGTITMVFSPIDLATYWVRDKLYLPWVAGDRSDIHVVMMPVADKDGNPLVPHFTREDIQRMERQWPDPVVRAARMYGEFITRSGLVLRGFNRETHIIKPFEIPRNYARWWIVDPEYHRFAALYFAADEEGNYYVTDEYFSQDDTLAHRAERMHLITGKRDTAVPCYVDSANPQDTAELNWHYSRLKTPIGAIPLPIQKNVEEMTLRTHALLEPNEKKLYPKITGLADLYGAPRIFFFNTLISTWKWEERQMQCSRLIWEMTRLSWGKNGKPDKDSAAGGDATDCLFYGCSVVQSGMKAQPIEEWRYKLPLGDVLIWDSIDRMDRRGKYNRRAEW
jgi:hypothetical protein